MLAVDSFADYIRSMTYTLQLPFPPSVNHYWRNFRGRMVIGSKGRAYRAEVCRRLSGIVTLHGPLAVEVVAHAPDRRRRDLDNILKAPLDALTHAGAYADDSQVKWLLIRWATVEKAAPGGALVVKISQISEKSGGLTIVKGH